LREISVADAGSSEVRPTISYDDFERVDIRVGTIVEARPFEGARKPAIQLWVDFGPEIGVRKSSAQITRHYTPEGVVGRQVAAVVNFPPRQIGKFMSEVLVLGFPDGEGEVVMIAPDRNIPNGGKLY
jgi:tRNA-binding protein